MGGRLPSSAIWASLVGEEFAGVAADLDPCTTKARMLFRPPYFVHICLVLEGKIQVFPVHHVETFIQPLVLGMRGQIFPCHLFTRVEPQMGGDIASDFVASYNQCHIFLGEKLRLPIMIAFIY